MAVWVLIIDRLDGIGLQPASVSVAMARTAGIRVMIPGAGVAVAGDNACRIIASVRRENRFDRPGGIAIAGNAMLGHRVPAGGLRVSRALCGWMCVFGGEGVVQTF